MISKKHTILFSIAFLVLITAILGLVYLHKVKYYEPVAIQIKGCGIISNEGVEVYGLTPFGKKILFQRSDSLPIWNSNWGFLKQIHINLDDSLLKDSIKVRMNIGNIAYAYDSASFIKDWTATHINGQTIYTAGEKIKGNGNFFPKAFSVLNWNPNYKFYLIIIFLVLLGLLFRKTTKSILQNLVRNPMNIGLFLFIAAFLFFLINKILIINNYAFDNNGIEQYQVYIIERIMLHERLYSNPLEPPFVPMFYTLLNFKIITTLLTFFISPPFNFNEVHMIYIVGRTVSLFFIIGIMLLLYLIYNKIFNHEWKIALIVAILGYFALSTPYFSIRPDALKTLFFLSAVLFFLKYLDNKSYVVLIFVSILCLLSIFSKQDAIGLPFMLGGYLLFNRKYKHLIVFTFSFLLVFAVIVGGHYFYYGKDFITYGLLAGDFEGFGFDWFLKVMLTKYFLSVFILFLIPIIISIKWLLKQQNEHKRFMAYMVIVSFIFSALISLRWGSTPIYFSEFHLLSLIVLCGFIFEKQWMPKDKFILKNKKYLSMIAILIVGFILLFYNIKTFGKPILHSEIDKKKNYETMKELFIISEYVKTNNLLVDRKYISDFTYNMVIFSPEKFLQPTGLQLFIHYKSRFDKPGIKQTNPKNIFPVKYFKEGFFSYFVVIKDSSHIAFANMYMNEYVVLKKFPSYLLYKCNFKDTHK